MDIVRNWADINHDSFSFGLHEESNKTWSACDITLHHRNMLCPEDDVDIYVGHGEGMTDIKAFKEAFEDMLRWLNDIHAIAYQFERESIDEIF